MKLFGTNHLRSGRRATARRVSAFFIILALTVQSLLFPGGAGAADVLPTGGVIRSGEGAIGPPTAGTLTVTQTGERMVIDWDSFSIGAENSVHFDQTLGVNGVALNRVVGGDPSEIFGDMTAPGQIFLVNPQGILFGEGAQVEVGSLVASTLSISDADFMVGDYTFSDGAVAQDIVNQGVIRAADGGYVALIAPQITNDETGEITARLGTVSLGAGGQAALQIVGDGLVEVVVKDPHTAALLANRGSMNADGGLVSFAAGVPVTATVIKQYGIVQAETAELKNGKIVLSGGERGQIELGGGELAASGETLVRGGAISVTGDTRLTSLERVVLEGRGILLGARLTQEGDGDLLLRSGTDGTQFGTVLFEDGKGYLRVNGSGDVEILYNPADPDDPLGPLRGYAHPTDYSPFVALSGGTLTSYMLVNDHLDFVRISENLNGTYAVGRDFDLGLVDDLQSIGSPDQPFSGIFDGRRHTIHDVIIDRGASNDVGLFGRIGSSGVVRDLSLSGVQISGRDYVGGLAAVNLGVISNVSLEGTINGHHFLGGLVGTNEGTVSDSSTAIVVSGSGNNVGGLVGQNAATGRVEKTSSAGTVMTEGVRAGGLIGENFGTLSGSTSGANVIGLDHVGGLAGASFGTIADAGVTGNVSGRHFVGGLLGTNAGTLSESESAGTVEATGNNVGGLVGQNTADGSVSAGRNSGTVIGEGIRVGGVVGENFGAVSGVRNVGAVTGYQHAGGLAGVNYGDVSDSVSKGAVHATTSHVGGLVGTNRGRVDGGTNQGDVSGESNIGGIVGVNYGEVTRTQNTGTVEGSEGSYHVGGLVGIVESEGSVSESNVFADVSGRVHVGGLVGLNKGTVSHTESRGNITGHVSVGGLIGLNTGSVSASSYDFGTVKGMERNIGGLIGMNDGNLSDSHSSGSVVGEGGAYVVGGLVGVVGPDGLVSNSHSISNVSAGGINVGGLVGENWGTIKHSFWSGGTVTGGSDRVGGLVGNNAYGVVESSYVDGPTLTVEGHGDHVGGLVGRNIEGTIRESHFGGGVVTGWNENVGGIVGTNLGDVIGSYSEGTTNGGGSSVGGVVGRNEGRIRGSYNQGNVVGLVDTVGGVVGLNLGTVTTSFSAQLSVFGYGDHVGGLVGRNLGEISDSYNESQVTGLAEGVNVGGLVGQNGDDGVVTRSYNAGSVLGLRDHVGGLIGENLGMVTDSYSTGTVLGTSDVVGGLVGTNSGEVSGSYSEGDVSSEGAIVGGLIGSNADAVIDSYSKGRVSGKSSYVGGLVGRNAGFVSGSHSAGNVSAVGNHVGGLVGESVAGSRVTRAYSTGDVLTQSFSVGGLIGTNRGNVSESYSLGTVVGHDLNVGGLIGENWGRVETSFSVSAVRGRSERVGGLIGNNVGVVHASYSLGPVVGTDHVGGLVGRSVEASSVTDSFSTGAVAGTGPNVGGLIGYGPGTVERSFWNVATSGRGTSAGGVAIGIGTVAMTNQTTYAEWDLGDTWRIVDGISYPYLEWQFGGEAPTVVRGAVHDVPGAMGAAGGIGVGVAVDGEWLGRTYTGADGSYYFATDPRDSGVVLTWLNSERFGGTEVGAQLGNALKWLTPEGHALGMEITNGLLPIKTDVSQMSVMVTDVLARALGDPDARESEVANGAAYTIEDGDVVVKSGVDLTMHVSGDLEVDASVHAENGTVLVVSGGHLTIDEGFGFASSAPGNAVVLAVAESFKNHAGENAISTPKGRYLVWSQSPLKDDRGGLKHDFRQYRAQYGMSEVLGEGSGFLYQYAPEVAMRLTGDISKVYDGGAVAPLSPGNITVTGSLAGERVIVSGLPTEGEYDSPNVGDGKRVTADITGIAIDSVLDGEVVIYGYRITPGGGTVKAAIGTIKPAPLNVRVVDASRVFGEENPTFRVSVDGFRLGDDESVLDGTLTFATLANPTSLPGAYRVAASGLSARNYTISYSDGMLTVTIPRDNHFRIPGLTDDVYRSILSHFYQTALRSSGDPDAE